MKISNKTKNSFRFALMFKKGWIINLGILIGFLIFLFFVLKSLENTKIFLFYYYLGVFVSLVIFISFGWIISNLVLKYRSLIKIKEYRNIGNPKVAIILGKDTWKGCAISTYLGIDYLLKYLKLKYKKISFYLTPSKREFNDLIRNKKIRVLYLIGHGSSRGFELNKKEGVSYSDYRNSKIVKDEIHLYHCGHGDGKTLINYLVKKENRKKCHSYDNKEMVISYILNFYDLYKQELKKQKSKK